MAKERSPNYPRIGLSDAVDLVKKFYGAEGRTPVDAETAAKAIGYGTLNGVSRGKLGALKKYGLLQGREDEISISQLGLRVVHPDDDADYESALLEAARTPEVFSALLETHAEASENAIVAFLIKNKGFTQEGAQQLAKSFKDTLAFAKLTGGNNNETGRREEGAGKDAAKMQSGQAKLGTKDVPPPPPPPPPVGDESVLTLLVPYRGASLSVRVEVPQGQRLTRDHIAKVRRFLELTEEDLDAPQSEVARPEPQTGSATQHDSERRSAAPHAAQSTAGHAGNSVSIPLMITHQLRADLRAAGYTNEQIDKMTPQQAHDNLAKRTA